MRSPEPGPNAKPAEIAALDDVLVRVGLFLTNSRKRGRLAEKLWERWVNINDILLVYAHLKDVGVRNVQSILGPALESPKEWNRTVMAVKRYLERPIDTDAKAVLDEFVTRLAAPDPSLTAPE